MHADAGAGAGGRDFYTFWWRAPFGLPAAAAPAPARRPPRGLPGCCSGGGPPASSAGPPLRRAWLLFRGANYELELYVNGQAVTLEEPRGMYLRRWVDVTAAARWGAPNALAALVAPPEHPGSVAKGGQGGDHLVAQDVTAQYVEGWDWAQPVPDRNSGLWGGVEAVVTGPVTVRDARARVSFPDPKLRAALASFSATLTNWDAALHRGTLRCTVTRRGDPPGATPVKDWAEPVSVAGGASLRVSLAEQTFERPVLWWPNGAGGQALYDFRLELELDGCAGVSDAAEEPLAFRDLAVPFDSALRARHFCVNGSRLFVRGGNFIVPDGMFRNSRQRCWDEVRYHAECGLNMIRLWGGASIPLADFYEACDHYGLLVWQEWWITGDCNGRGATPDSPLSDPNWPLDHGLWLRCVADTVRAVRNHPCVALYCGGNEQVPCRELNSALQVMFGAAKAGAHPAAPAPAWAGAEGACLDDSRFYLEGSMWDGFAKGDGAFSDGPYGIQPLRAFFQDSFYPYGFNPEVGSVGVPEAAAVRRMFPEGGDALEPPAFRQAAQGLEDVPSAAWDHHKSLPFLDASGTNHVATYGLPRSLEEFCARAQMASYAQYRALLEGWASRMWSKYSGVLVWKTQNPWPGLRGAFYDWWLNPLGGHFGAKCALELLHPQLNLDTLEVEIVNLHPTQASAGVRVDCTVCSLLGLQAMDSQQVGPVGSQSVVRTGLHVDPPAGPQSPLFPVYFVLLELSRVGESARLARNMYWLHADGADFSALHKWSDEKQPLRVSAAPAQEGEAEEAAPRGAPGGVPGCDEEARVVVQVSNPGTRVVFGLQLSVVPSASSAGPGAGAAGPQPVAPVFFSDNYITLAPGEAHKVDLTFRGTLDGTLSLAAEAWNSEPVPDIPLTATYQKKIY